MKCVLSVWVSQDFLKSFASKNFICFENSFMCKVLCEVIVCAIFLSLFMFVKNCSVLLVIFKNPNFQHIKLQLFLIIFHFLKIISFFMVKIASFSSYYFGSSCFLQKAFNFFILFFCWCVLSSNALKCGILI